MMLVYESNKPIKLYIHAFIDYKKQGSAVLITIRCEEKLIECCF